MSAFTLRVVLCDAEACGEEFTTGRNGTGITETRKAARAEGWSHPDGWTDLCPEHTKQRRAQ